MTPKAIHRVKKLALEKARQELENFQKDIKILLLLTKKKRTVKLQLKKSERLKVIKDHLEEFESTKEVLDACHEHEKEP